jgi:hypothetical protein
VKSHIRTFVLPALAAASKRPMVTIKRNRNQLRFRFTTPHLFMLLALKLVFSFYSLRAL